MPICKLQRILVTGGAGFIGSCLVRHLIRHTPHQVFNMDCLTYAGNLSSLEEVVESDRYTFERADIADREAVSRILAKFRPGLVMNLAAQSHVDRSITGASPFIDTNIVGTYALLDECLAYWKGLDKAAKDNFRFLHVSTDEVYGSLGDTGQFNESSPYDPRSPYSASKAAADHLVRAWHHTYGLPVLLTHCSNNYGPFQYPEKLIPRMIINALSEQDMPVYGDGGNVRDWIFVKDHVEALLDVVQKGTPGVSYNIGAGREERNIDMVRAICRILDTLRPRLSGGLHEDLITFVTDRPGHDYRYAINPARINALGWHAGTEFAQGLEATVRWYLEHEEWWRPLLDEAR